MHASLPHDPTARPTRSVGYRPRRCPPYPYLGPQPCGNLGASLPDCTCTRIRSPYESRHFTSPAESCAEADTVEALVDTAVACNSAENGSNICVVMEEYTSVVGSATRVKGGEVVTE